MSTPPAARSGGWRARAGKWASIAVLSGTLIGLNGAAGAGRSIARMPPAGAMANLPRLTVWAWERREDLRALDPRTTAVAYLDRTVLVDREGVRQEPRRQSMLLPAAPALVRIAVVRVEVGAGTPLGEAEAEGVARDIAEAAQADRVAALQVDFDARASERSWYAGVLRRLRARMPAKIPLSMTALASWCSYDGGWMHGLPVDEAVPMLFRMEPDRRRAQAGAGWGKEDYAIREPLCRGSVGISTRETWPPEIDRRRAYVFADRGWARDGLQETIRRLE